jgi:hypothetical protein
MSTYRCYFIDNDDHIGGPAEMIEATSTSEALTKALAMLGERPHYRTIEVWIGESRVYPPIPVSLP